MVEEFFTGGVGDNESMRIYLGEKSPREAPNADRPGDYSLAIRAREAEGDPGDYIHLELYITGYGQIHGSKLVFYPPTYFIDEERSFIRSELDPGEEQGNWSGQWQWGSIDRQLGWETGLTMLMSGGISSDTWEDKHPSNYFDID
jgi:hypothetical protein